MFPTANSSIYRNEDGEVLGWDIHHDDAPDPDEYYDSYDCEAPEPKDTEQCIAWGMHARDGDGTDIADIWECAYCSGLYTFWDEGEALVTKEQFDILKTRLTPRQVIDLSREEEGPNMAQEARGDFYSLWARAYDRQEIRIGWDEFLDTLH